ncbi:IS3 family transposase [Megasphaera stantonii]|uniref:IS3 family transposase n=1 Tax=Megasphaera stantonii TaxID=2144175 RepID=UPI003D18CE31
MVCRNFILPEFCKPCLFFIFAKLIVPYQYYNEQRIKEKLGWKSPVQYRRSLSAA